MVTEETRGEDLPSCGDCGAPLTQEDISCHKCGWQAASLEIYPAGLFFRLLAGLVDWTLASALTFGLYLVLYISVYALGLEGDEGATQDARGLAIVLIAMLLAPWLYFASMESSSLQGPIGKAFLGLKVVDGDRRQISFRHATVRHIAKVGTLFTVGAGLLLVLFTPKKRALHDALSRTSVLKDDSGPEGDEEL